MKAIQYIQIWGTSLVVQWLSLCTPTAGGAGSIPGWGTKVPHAAQRSKRKQIWDSKFTDQNRYIGI